MAYVFNPITGKLDDIGTPLLPATGLVITKTGDWTPSNPVRFYNVLPEQAVQINDSYIRFSGKWISAFSYSESNWISGQQRILSLTFDDLAATAGTFSLTSTGAITTLSLPSLSYVGTIFSPSTMASLTTLSLPSLSYVGTTFNPNTMANLTTLSLPVDGTLKFIGGNVTVTGMALNQASVNNILQALASLDGTNNTVVYGTGRSVDLSGGTNSSPSFVSTTTTAGSNFSGVGTTCTVNLTSHGYSTGDVLRVSGVTVLTNANRYAVISVVNANQFTYTITSQTATGAGTATIIKASASAAALVTRGVTLTTN